MCTKLMWTNFNLYVDNNCFMLAYIFSCANICMLTNFNFYWDGFEFICIYILIFVWTKFHLYMYEFEFLCVCIISNLVSITCSVCIKQHISINS